MRVLSIIALLSASYVAATDNLRASVKETSDVIAFAAEEAADIAAQEKRHAEERHAQGENYEILLALNAKEREVEELKAQLNAAVDEPSLGACTDDSNWRDKTGLGCGFYFKNPDWCSTAIKYTNNGKSAKDACCVCGGGDSGYGKGVYWVKNKKSGDYLGIYKITSPHVRMSDNLWSPYIKIEVVPLVNNEYALMSHRYGDRFLNVDESGKVGLDHVIGDWERFKIQDIQGGVQFYNVKWGLYLDVYDGVRTSKSPLGEYTSFNMIPAN